jgi:hypothetical protein
MLPQEIPAPDFNCGFADWQCGSQELLAAIMSGFIGGLADFTADMLGLAFSDSAVTDQGWSIADGQFWFWISVMVIVLVGVAMVQMVPALLLRSWSRLAQIGGGLVVAVPASVLAVIFMQRITAFGDEVTDSLLRALRDQTMAVALLRMFGLIQRDGDIVDVALTSALHPTTFLTPDRIIGQQVSQYVLALLVMALMALAALFLYVGMSIRAFGLIALAATAPIGFMMIGQPKVGVWATQWVKMALGLIIAKPLAAAVLLLAVQVAGSATSLGLLFVAIGATFAAAFAPLWAVRLVGFASDQVTAAMQRPSLRQGSNDMRQMSSVLSQVVKR